MSKSKEKKEKKFKPHTTVTEKQIKEVPETVGVQIEGQPLMSQFKEFKTGSKGWNFHGKVMVNNVKCQVSGNIIIIGSKNI